MVSQLNNLIKSILDINRNSDTNIFPCSVDVSSFFCEKRLYLRYTYQLVKKRTLNLYPLISIQLFFITNSLFNIVVYLCNNCNKLYTNTQYIFYIVLYLNSFSLCNFLNNSLLCLLAYYCFVDIIIILLINHRSVI